MLSFLKLKTACVMRFSYCSSVVCSSYLAALPAPPRRRPRLRGQHLQRSPRLGRRQWLRLARVRVLRGALRRARGAVGGDLRRCPDDLAHEGDCLLRRVLRARRRRTAPAPAPAPPPADLRDGVAERRVHLVGRTEERGEGKRVSER